MPSWRVVSGRRRDGAFPSTAFYPQALGGYVFAIRPSTFFCASSALEDTQKQWGNLLSAGEAETLVGHAVGGVCPFAVNEGVEVYLDASLKRFETVFPACGSSNSAIELSIPELEKFSGYSGWIDVCKGWEP